MLQSQTYTVGEKKPAAWDALYAMIPQKELFDRYLHRRLAGDFASVCVDRFFFTHENGEGLSRVWMCEGKHENAVANWGAVFTPEQFRGKGYCAKTLDYCLKEIDALPTPPLALFCTAGTLELTQLYRKYGFVPAITGRDRGPLYRPQPNGPLHFREFCQDYYTDTQALYQTDAHFGWRNEIDCLLRFALWDLGEDFGFANCRDLWILLMDEPHRAKILLTKENKCVGWMVDGQIQVHPKYRDLTPVPLPAQQATL